MDKRTLGPEGPEVSEIGLGCMGMSAFYGSHRRERSDRARSTARSSSAATSSTPPTCTARTPTRTRRPRRSPAAATRSSWRPSSGSGSRCDDDGRRRRSIDGSPDYVRAACEGSLRRLGVEHIDLYYQHRVDPSTPIEETVGAMAELVAGGQGPPPRPLGGERRDDPPRARGAPDHRRAERVLAVDARRRGRDPADAARSSASRSSPTRRSGAASSRAASPRPRSSTRATSAATGRASPARTCRPTCKLAERVRELAAEKGITPGQLALAWVLHRGEHIVPIPGHQARELPRGEPRRRRGRAERRGGRADRRGGPGGERRSLRPAGDADRQPLARWPSTRSATSTGRACFNVRDLGGLPAAGGRRTARGALVRADSLSRLTPAGWQALARSRREHGDRPAQRARAPRSARRRQAPRVDHDRLLRARRDRGPRLLAADRAHARVRHAALLPRAPDAKAAVGGRGRQGGRPRRARRGRLPLRRRARPLGRARDGRCWRWWASRRTRSPRTTS